MSEEVARVSSGGVPHRGGERTASGRFAPQRTLSSVGARVPGQYALFLWFLVAFDLSAQLTPPGFEPVASAVHASLLMGGSLFTLRRLAREVTASILSPLSYVLLLTTVFYGVGVLFYNVANEASRDWVDRHYAVTGSELLMVNLLVAVGLATIWTAASWVISAGRTGSVKADRREWIGAFYLARYFFVVGFGVQYGLIVPYMLGWLPFVLPGVAMLMVNVSYSSIFLMAVLFRRSKGREHRILLPTGVIAGVFAGLLVTSKTWVVLTLVFYFLGSFYGSRRARGLLIGVLLVVAVYVAVTPLVHFVRNSAVDGGSREVSQSVSVWVDFAEGSDISASDDTQWWFLRLSYVGAQAFAVSEFTTGSSGDSVIGGLRDVILPRVLFPDKPVSAPGRSFSEAYNGNADSSISPGLIAEAFWNGGWIAVFLVSAVFGIVVGMAHRFITNSVRSEEWLRLPLCISLFLGLGQINGFFVPTLVYQPMVALAIQSLLCLGLVAAGRSPFRNPRHKGRRSSVEGRMPRA